MGPSFYLVCQPRSMTRKGSWGQNPKRNKTLKRWAEEKLGNMTKMEWPEKQQDPRKGSVYGSK